MKGSESKEVEVPVACPNLLKTASYGNHKDYFSVTGDTFRMQISSQKAQKDHSKLFEKCFSEVHASCSLLAELMMDVIASWWQ